MKNKIRILLTVVLCVISCIVVNAETKYINSETEVELLGGRDSNAGVKGILEQGEEVEEILSIETNGEDWSAVISENDGFGFVKSDCLDDTREDRTYLGTWTITAYAETGYPCANGNYPSTGYTIACNSLPFGSVVYIDGVGYRTVEDRGPGNMGDAWCDLYLGDTVSCVNWGVQYRDVYLVN